MPCSFTARLHSLGVYSLIATELLAECCLQNESEEVVTGLLLRTRAIWARFPGSAVWGNQL